MALTGIMENVQVFVMMTLAQVPSFTPSYVPSKTPTHIPSVTPTHIPSDAPTYVPSKTPTHIPSNTPTIEPTTIPSLVPTILPTRRPTGQPSSQPTSQPSRQPSRQPTAKPSTQPSSQPTRQPSTQPTSQPSTQPSRQPTRRPSSQPTGQPSRQPSSQPTRRPSSQPTGQPSRQPSSQPTRQPSGQPTSQPSTQPSSQPTSKPSIQPSSQPTRQPSSQPTSRPSTQPSSQPIGQPSRQPSSQPTRQPSGQPSNQPTSKPTSVPTTPTSRPSSQPSGRPSSQPTSLPSGQPTSQPSQPTSNPSSQPSRQPSRQPSSQPSSQPSRQPSASPTGQPSSLPSSLPSSCPSAQPSSTPTNPVMFEVFFEVNVILSGINETMFKSNWEENIEVIRLSIKSVIPDLSHKKYIDVLNVTLSATDSEFSVNSVELLNSGIYSVEDRLHISRLLNAPYLVLHLEIGSIISTTKEYQSIAEDMYNQFTATLTAQINNGALQAKIRSYSNANSGILGQVTIANSKIASTFETLMLRSPNPTSSPTGMPTCGLGSFGAPGDCGPCPPGTYTDKYNQIKCQLCPTGQYSTTYDAEFCLDCKWPHWSIFAGSTECAGYFLNTSGTVYYGTMFFLVMVFLVCLSFGGEYKVPAFAIMLFPTMDILSDLAYIMTSIYYDKYVFLSSVFFFIAPNFLWFFKVYEMNAYPCFYIPFPGYALINENIVFLSSENGIPLVNGDRPKGIPTRWERVDSIAKLCLVLPFWLFYIPQQLMMFGLLMLWIILHSPILIFWGGIGIFLFQCKVLSIAVVWNIWFLGWVGPTRAVNYYKHIKLDTAILNESLFAEFISETLPQLGLQSFNNSLTNTFSTVGIFSSALSVTIAFNGLYRYGYYTLYKGYKIGEVPTENFAAVAIGVKLVPAIEDVAGRSELDLSKLLDNKRAVLYPALDSGMIMHPEEIAFLLLLYQGNKKINKWLKWNNILSPHRLLECRLVKLKNVIKLIDDDEFSADLAILFNSFKDRIQEKGNNEDVEPQVSVWDLLITELDRDLIVFLFRHNILSPNQLYYASNDTLLAILGLITNPKKKIVVGKYFQNFPAMRQTDARDRIISNVVKDKYFNDYEDFLIEANEENDIFSDVSGSDSDSDSDSDTTKPVTMGNTTAAGLRDDPMPAKDPVINNSINDIRDDLSVTSATSLDNDPSFLREIDDVVAAIKHPKGWLW